jgi:anti-sigma B factor antagonist
MKIEAHGDTLLISEFGELDAVHAPNFREQARKAMTDGHCNVEVDLSKTTFIDSCGLGALVSLHKSAASRNGRVRLLHPQPQVQQILDLTRMPLLFEIVKP